MRKLGILPGNERSPGSGAVLVEELKAAGAELRSTMTGLYVDERSLRRRQRGGCSGAGALSSLRAEPRPTRHDGR